MKTIKIFIGSSVDKKEFEIEREKLGSFINGLNREYIKQGVFIDFYDCETVSNKMKAEGSQKQHDDYIENEADATFFMFFKKAGEFTLHELQVAREALVNKNRPDIFTYFKVVGDDIEQTDEIKKAVDVIANSYGHYFSKFTDADTIKLAMLQYIVEKLNDGFSVTINDGTVYVNNTKIDGISIDNIFAYQNNTEYKKLQQDIDDLTVSIDKAIENKQFDNIESLTVQKEEKEKLLAKLENDILNMLMNMQKELKKSNADPIRMQAYQLLEMGKIKEAQALFPIDVLKAKSENLLLKNEMQQSENADIVECAKIRIEALKLDVSNPDRFKMIEDTYEAVIENSFICYDIQFVYGFSVFLDDQNKSQKAYEIARRLEGLYLFSSDKFEKFDVAHLYNNLGIICGHLALYDEQEDYYLKAIKIREILAKNNSERFNPDLATSYNNAGVFYRKQDKPNKAEFYYLKASKIIENLTENSPSRFNYDLAIIYNNLGLFYENQGSQSKAECYCLKAIKIIEDLAENNPKRFNFALAISYNNAGLFYKNQGGQSKAEYYCLKAIKIIEDLAENNPERFNPNLADYYYNAGIFYDDQGSQSKAECFYLKAIKIRENLAGNNPERFNSDLADCYHTVGVFYEMQREPQKAEDYFLKAIGIRECLSKNNPERFNSGLANSYNRASVFYNKQGSQSKAECYCLKAIEIREDLAKNNPERFNSDLAISYYNFGFFTNDKRFFDKALKTAQLQPNNPYCKAIIDKLKS